MKEYKVEDHMNKGQMEELRETTKNQEETRKEDKVDITREDKMMKMKEISEMRETKVNPVKDVTKEV